MAVWSEITLSEVDAAARLDAEYFSPDYLALEGVLVDKKPSRIDDFAFVTDGIHASPEVVDDGGTRYLSAKCVKDNDIITVDTLRISESQNAANKRTQLKRDDVLITTVGTIGNAAVVTEDILPANADRHLGIIRINAGSRFDPYYLATFLNTRLGRFQTLREATGNVQLNLFIEKIKTLRVVDLPGQRRVADLARQGYARRRDAERLYREAEALLESSLGLDELDQTPRMAYERPFVDLQTVGRLDAEYFQPPMQDVIATLSRDGQTIGDVAELRTRRYRAAAGTAFQYIEIGDVSDAGEAVSSRVLGEVAPSRATWIVEPGDVVTSTVRPIRRLSAIIADDQGGSVCSSGFAVLAPRDIAPEVLLVYLRMPLVCALLDLHTTASMYPAISTADLMKMPIAVPDDATLKEIVAKVRESMDARSDAKRHLDAAKSAVEEAIGGGE